MTGITCYNFNGADVRTVTLPSGEPGFVGKDVAERLGYEDATTAIRSHCRGVQILHPIPDALGRMQPTRILTEPDVLRLIVSSTLPEAETFERWVFEEVLPSIRRTGQYATSPATVAPAPMLPVDLLQQADALKALLGDDELKRLAPLLWQEIADGAQNAMRRALGAPLALPPASDARLLDVVEIARSAGINLPQNLRGAAGKYVKARVQGVETERIIGGSIRKSIAYADRVAVAAALREYLAKRAK